MSTFSDRHRSDFNWNNAGNAGSFGDLFWRSDSGENAIFLMNNNVAGTIAAMPFVSPDWHYIAARDFSDATIGNSDILWQNDNGSMALWKMEGTTVSSIVALPDVGPTWHAVTANDFSGDRGCDVLFQNDNGSLAIWTFTSETAPPGVFGVSQNPGPTWHVVGSGDTDGDGFAGILWQNDGGALALWEAPSFVFPVVGNTVRFDGVFALPTVDPTWHVKGMGDLRGNGFANVVFQNDNGQVVVWDLVGSTASNMNLVNLNPGPSWHVVSIRDMNNDGKSDLLLQHDTGTAAVWENYQSLGGGAATFTAVLAITPNPNPNGLDWDVL